MADRELTDTQTVTWDGSVPTEAKANVVKQMSITADASGLKLEGDSAAPGATKVYGTDGTGTKGWRAESGGGGSGGLILVEKQIVLANAQDITFSGLDGNTDGVYRLLARIINNSGGVTSYSLRPNNVTTNQSSIFHYDQNGVAHVTAATLQLTTNSADVGNGIWINISLDFWAQNNPNSIAAIRQYQGHLGIATTGPAAGSAQFAGVWNETATNLTSLVVHAASANGIGNGSELTLYKYAQS